MKFGSLCVISLGCIFAFSGVGLDPNRGAVWSQEETPETAPAVANTDEGATIHGKIVLIENSPIEFDVTSLEIMISEQIDYLPLPIPAEWGQFTVEQRKDWFVKFQESEDGKAFLAAREAQQQAQRRFPVKLEADGSFEVFDVPPGKYNIFGRKDVELDAKRYAVEVFGQFEVADVDEIPWDPLPVEITRLLDIGDLAPDFQVDAMEAAAAPLKLSALAGRPVFLHIWSAQAIGTREQAAALKKAYDVLKPEVNLEIVSICVDKELEAARELIDPQIWTWPQGRTLGWEHPVFRDYGLQSVPVFILIDKDGKILLSSVDVFPALNDPNADLAGLLRRAIDGTLVKESEKGVDVESQTGSDKR